MIWSEIQRSGPIGLKMSDLVRFLYARDVVEDNWNLDQAPIQIIEMQVLPIELRNWNCHQSSLLRGGKRGQPLLGSLSVGSAAG